MTSPVTAPDAGEPAIHIEGLTKDFGDLRAVDNLNLDVARRSVFGFLGPNGAGKTTTLRLLLGILDPTAGKVTILGRDPAREGDRVRAGCGALLEHHGLYERLSAEENLLFYGRINRMSRSEIEARTHTLLEGFDLWDRRGDRVRSWSKGMKQKLAIARALLHQPTLLLLDEPTSGLDARSAAGLRRDLMGLTEREDVTVFLTTHNLSEAEQMCDAVGIFKEGRLLAVGAPEELRRGPGAPVLEIVTRGIMPDTLAELAGRLDVASVAPAGASTLRLELVGGGEAGPIVSWLVSRNVEVAEVRAARTSLEDVFLDLVEDDG